MNQTKLLTREPLFLTGCAIIGLHLLASLILPTEGTVTCVFVILCYGLAIYACFQRSRRSGGTLRVKWRFIAFSFFLNIVAFLLILGNRYLAHMPQMSAGVQDFVAFLRGIPLLLAVALPDSRQDSRFTVPVGAAQVSLFAGLSYFVIFFPHAGRGLTHVYTNMRTTHLFLIEYGLLAVVFTLRLIGRYTAERTILYRSVCGYLWAITAASYFANEIVDLRWSAPAGSALYIVIDVVLVGFALYVATVKPSTRGALSNQWSNTLDFASPTMIPFAVFFLAVYVVRTSFVIGVGAMACSLALFALRTTLLQLSYRRIQQQLLLENQLSRSEALVDQLTGIPNRRNFDRTLDREWRRAERNHQPVGLLMIDIDHFKALNDTYGHLEGDQYLRRIAGILDSKLRRASDFLSRYGGEEFAVVLTDASVEDIILIGESVRLAVSASGMTNPGSPLGCVSVSIGVAWMQPSKALTPPDLIAMADRALYQAKRNGRNRVEMLDHELMRMA